MQEKEIRISEPYYWSESEGLFKSHKKGKVYVGNFYPYVDMVQETPEGKEVVLTLIFSTNRVPEVKVPVKRLSKVDWFELCQQCILNGENKEASASMKNLVRKQVAEYEGRVANITRYTELGWNTDVYGSQAYVFGNSRIGGSREAEIDSSLQKYQMEFSEDRQGEFLRKFIYLWMTAPYEAKITILYFFTGLVRQLYKDAGVPVNFSLYVLGKQQSRKTTLVRTTATLYCRSTDIDFSIRTIEKTSVAVAEKLISAFKDTTLILDDVSKTGDKKYQQVQENVVERVARTVGNSVRKSNNVGSGMKEYSPNANVIFTGEYVPHFSESTLSRMLILEIEQPVESDWLIEFEKEPEMYSTVAYSFLAWIQMNYEKYVDFIRCNFAMYREVRKGQVPYQERIQEHAFIMQNTSHMLHNFMAENGYLEEIDRESMRISDILHNLLERQVVIMEKYALKNVDHNFCSAFAELYITKRLQIAEDAEDYDKNLDDGFMRGKEIICISTGKMCGIMQHYYSDISITIQAITKQLRDNRFLCMDGSRSARSTKKVKNARYLHIMKTAVKEYYTYCRQI